MQTSKDEVQGLLSASDDELNSLLGLNALLVERSPGELLSFARSGGLAGSATVLGDAYKSDKLEQVGRSFLDRWKAEFRAAICGDSHLLSKERETALNELHLLVNSVVVTLATQIPALAPFSGLLLVVAVMMVKSGLTAWCKE